MFGNHTNKVKKVIFLVIKLHLKVTHTIFLKETTMPYVNVKLAGEVTREQKAQIAKEITDTLERVARKPKSYTYITFEEVAYEDWAIGGKLLDE